MWVRVTMRVTHHHHIIIIITIIIIIITIIITTIKKRGAGEQDDVKSRDCFGITYECWWRCRDRGEAMHMHCTLLAWSQRPTNSLRLHVEEVSRE